MDSRARVHSCLVKFDTEGHPSFAMKPFISTKADAIDKTLANSAVDLRIEQLSGPEAFEKITAEWEELDAQISPRTPFTSPLWAKVWWRHVRQSRPSIRQEFFAHIVRDENGRLLAIVPLMISHRPALGPVRLRLLQFLGGADGSITEHRGIVCRETDEPLVVKAVARYLQGRKDEWDLFIWTGLRNVKAVRDQAGSQLRYFQETPYYLLPLPDSWEKFRSGLSINTKEAIRKCYKSLTRQGHAFTFHAKSRPHDVLIALDRLLALHSERAKFEYSIKHRDFFTKASHCAFITDVAYLMAGRDQLRIFELEVDGKIVASRMAFLLDNELYLYYSGYELAWRKHSVMTTLMCECFKWAIQRGIKSVNLSKGTDRSKLRWRGRKIAFYDAHIVSSTWRGKLCSLPYYLVRRKSEPPGSERLFQLSRAE